MTLGSLPSMIATTEFVVPRSMRMILPWWGLLMRGLWPARQRDRHRRSPEIPVLMAGYAQPVRDTGGNFNQLVLGVKRLGARLA